MQIGLYSISFGFSWGPVGWLIPSEIHDLNTRSAGQSITVFTQLVSGATVTQSTPASLLAPACILPAVALQNSSMSDTCRGDCALSNLCCLSQGLIRLLKVARPNSTGSLALVAAACVLFCVAMYLLILNDGWCCVQRS